MARIARHGAALALTLVTAVVTTLPVARAQALQRLTVESFTLSADTAKPKLEVPFHLIVSLHVREQVVGIDNLELPILAELELLGDERRIENGAYRETITVVAHHTGAIAIAPATLQAIDARDGRAKQWFTNALTLNVSGGSLEPLRADGAVAIAVLRAVVRALAWLVGILCAIAIVVLLVRRRGRPPAVAPPPAPPRAPPVAPHSRTQRLQDALTVLRAERTRASAVRVRAAIWRMVGASDGETLADVLQRPQAQDMRTRELLRALERGAFTYEDDLRRAIDDACAELERSIA